jgi:hypothetical protein
VAAEIAAEAEADAKVEAKVEAVEAAVAEVVETVRVTGRKRKAVKAFFKGIFGGKQEELSPFAIASFLAAPEQVDPALEGASIDKLVADLKAEGVSEAAISTATVSILPYLTGQEAPGVPSTEKPA